MGLPIFVVVSEMAAADFFRMNIMGIAMRHVILVVCVLGFVVADSLSAQTADPLPSWNEGATKTAIIKFVEAVTTEGSPKFVPPAQRIATFDNDGTLWLEYPMYTQVLFAFDRIKKLALEHPEWKTTQPFKALLEGDMKTVGDSGMKGLMEIVMASHSGMTAEQFEQESIEWLANTKQSRFDRIFTELIYQPQVELLEYLRANDFKTFIVSGGGIAFMRPMTEKAYGIPRDQVVGSIIESEFQIKDGKAEVVRQPKIHFIDDKATKPVGIYNHIGQRPILSFGNSDSDMEMIEYATGGDGPGLGLYVHHTDAEREYAYDRKSHVGKLDKALDQAEAKGWIIVDMKNDWKTVFPPK